MRDGDDYVINGRKWWTSGAGDPRCKMLIFMGKTDPGRADGTAQQSMILVPARRAGRQGRAARSRCSATTTRRTATRRSTSRTCACRRRNMLLGEGRGFEIAQGRLGPGRIHHCMRLIGLAERALETDVPARSKSRVAFGKPIAEQAVTLRAHRRGAHHDRPGAPAGAEGRLHDGHGRQQGGARPRSR